VNVQITNSYGDPVFQTGLTPNNDGYNDTYTIGNIGPQLGTATPCDWLPFTEFAVFTRWGQRVFVASDYRNSWDGTDSDGNPLPDGTYFAVFTHNGSSYSSFIDIRR
jgi:gliding motility-associated-like protein